MVDNADALAQRLLDAQVTWLVTQLTGSELAGQIEQDLDALLAAGSRINVGALVDEAAVKATARHLFSTVPASAGATALVETGAAVVHSGPTEAFSLSDLIDRHHVEALVDEALGLNHLVEPVLDGLVDSPLVAAMAAKFVGKIVNDVLQANRAVAEKIPGVGSLVSLSASAAGRVTGAADKQFGALLGDTAGKGAVFAMRRLNKVILEIIKDPQLKAAILQVYDLYADQPLPQVAELGSLEDTQRVAGLLQDIVIAGAPTEPVLTLTEALIGGFFTVYGEHPVSVLLEELDLTRDDLLKHAQALVPSILRAAYEAGELEGLLRQRLAPFYESAEFAAAVTAD